jgi:hypothetical protein
MCTREVKDNPQGYRSPSEYNMNYRDIYIKTSDDLKLHGWFVFQADSKNAPTVIYFHENAGST